MFANIQTRLFEKILEKYARKSEAVEALEALLSVGKDAIYRRFRGDTFLTPDELELLAKTYKISLDKLAFGHSDAVMVSFNAFEQPAQSFVEFVSNIHQQIKQLNELPDAHFYYASHEIPVFHYMYFPELICFKFYVWGVTSWGFDYLKDKQFSFDIMPHPVRELCEKSINLYNRVPTTELWSLGIVDNTLNQIEYVATVDRFQNPTDGLLLCDKLLHLVQHMKTMAEHGKKHPVDSTPHEGSATFNLYHNELVSTNNMMLVNSSVGRYLVATFCNPNFFRSMDEKLCDYTEEWMERIISQSSSISTHSAKDRDWFFSRLEKKIKRVRNRIEVELEE